jgi:hypothetical protein
MNVERLADTVGWIPHLDLGLEFDLNPLRGEFLALSQKPDIFQPYRSTIPAIADAIAASWHGASLFSPDGSLHGDLQENSKNFSGRCIPTPLATMCPAMTKVVEDLGGEHNRARVMIVQPKGQLTWHSHIFDGVDDFRPNILVCHVPIFTPPKFRYSVIPIRDFRLGDHENNPMKVYTEKYVDGRATVFNSLHMHCVFNDSDIHARVSIMMYLDLLNPKTYEIVERAAANYTGEHIPR